MRKRKSKTIVDPFAAREQERYENPIPSREYIMAHLDAEGRPLGFLELATHFSLDEDDERLRALKRRLRAMEREGQVVFNSKEEYGLASKMELVRGHIVAQKGGEGFVMPDDGSAPLFIPTRQMREFFHNDRVLARVTGEGKPGAREGVVVEVLDRATISLIGRYQERGGFGVVFPFNRRLVKEVIIPQGKAQDAQDGDIVRAKITVFPSHFEEPAGEIEAVLAPSIMPGMEIDLAIGTYGIPNE
jgi:ribonuclease R